MKKILFVQLAVTLFSINILFSQNIKLKSCVGFSEGTSPNNGIVFSTELAFPISKWAELSPTFTNISDIYHLPIFYNWTYNSGVNTDVNKSKSGKISSYYELYLYLKPLEFFKQYSGKFDIGVGFGYGLNSYEYHVYSFIDDYLSGVITKKGFRINYAIRTYINLKNKHFDIGLVASALDLTDEGELMVGLQISKKLN